MNKNLFIKRWCKLEKGVKVELRDLDLDSLIEEYLRDYQNFIFIEGYCNSDVYTEDKEMSLIERFMLIKKIGKLL
jgi:hypothetical protein